MLSFTTVGLGDYSIKWFGERAWLNVTLFVLFSIIGLAVMQVMACPHPSPPACTTGSTTTHPCLCAEAHWLCLTVCLSSCVPPRGWGGSCARRCAVVTSLQEVVSSILHAWSELEHASEQDLKKWHSTHQVADMVARKMHRKRSTPGNSIGEDIHKEACPEASRCGLTKSQAMCLRWRARQRHRQLMAQQAIESDACSSQLQSQEMRGPGRPYRATSNACDDGQRQIEHDRAAQIQTVSSVVDDYAI